MAAEAEAVDAAKAAKAAAAAALPPAPTALPGTPPGTPTRGGRDVGGLAPPPLTSEASLDCLALSDVRAVVHL